MIKDPIIYKDSPGDRELDLRPDGVDCIPVSGMSNYQSIQPDPEYHIHPGCMEFCLCLKGNLMFDSAGRELRFYSAQHLDKTFKRIIGRSPTQQRLLTAK